MIQQIKRPEDLTKVIDGQVKWNNLPIAFLTDSAQVDKSTYYRLRNGQTRCTLEVAMKLLHAAGMSLMVTNNPEYYGNL